MSLDNTAQNAPTHSVAEYEATHGHSDPTYSAARFVAGTAIAGAALWLCAIAIFLLAALHG